VAEPRAGRPGWRPLALGGALVVVAALGGLGLLGAVRRWRAAHTAPLLGHRVDPPQALPPQLTLEDSAGRPVLLQTVLDAAPAGSVALIYFGYTRCGDVCPRALAHLAQARRALGADSSRLLLVFITSDPAYDTPHAVRAYTQRFDPAMIGFAGTPQEIAAAQDAFRVNTYDNNPVTEDAHMRGPVHPISFYIIDRAGRLRHVLPVYASPGRVAQAARAMMS
jgi:cytochrome oxidase Cu insertion factor (SCO1/SenC/PrrC family)